MAAERPLNTFDILYMDNLTKAVEALQTKENLAAENEGIEPLCGEMMFVAIHQSSGEFRVGMSFGMMGDRTCKSARIIKVDDWTWRLEWT